MAVIDAHAHIYPEKIASKAVDAVGAFYGVEMFDGGACSPGTPEALLACTNESPITHFIVHSVATTSHAVTSINDFIADQARRHPEFIGFGTMHPDFEDKEAEVNRVIELGLHGFKIHPDTQMVDTDDPRLMEFYEIIAGRLPITIHTGDYRHDFSHPRRLARVLDTFPELVVDAAHFGGWSIYDQGYDHLGGYENLFIDTSSSQPIMGDRHTAELVRMWGVDRVMWGSDHPMWSPISEYEAFRALDFTDEEFDAMLWHNAERFAGVTVR